MLDFYSKNTMDSDQYRTVVRTSEGIYKEKGSKFLAFAYHVENQDDIKAIIHEVQKEYFDARHRCYAWRLGQDVNNNRANDDGEPSGTAGRPILGQILSAELTNVLIVVVRYFGGIKLGTSGLINAYKTAAYDAIANAEVVVREVEDYYTMTFAYEAMNDVMKALKDDNPRIVGQQFDLSCKIDFAVRQLKTESLVEKLQKITSVKLRLDHSI